MQGIQKKKKKGERERERELYNQELTYLFKGERNTHI